MSGHTKEPWRVTADGFIASGGFVPIRTPFREGAFKAGPGRSDHSDELLDANARRIVACVNACEGIDTDLIEPRMLGDQIAAKMAVIKKCDRLNTENAALNDYCATVEQQRDRLLSVLKMFAELDACDGQRDRLAEFDAKHGVGDKGRYSFFFGAVRTAIAEVEGSDHEPV